MWLIENESENFSVAYFPTCVATFSQVFLWLFFTRCRLLPNVSVSVPIPAVLADRFEDTNDADETAVRSF